MTLLYSMLNTTLVTTPCILLMLLLAPIMDKKLAAGGRLLFWLIAIIGLCAPIVSFIPRPTFQIEITIPTVIEERMQTVDESKPLKIQTTPSIVVPSDNSNQAEEISLHTAGHNELSVRQTVDRTVIILAMWLTGIFISALYHAASYFRFQRFVKRWSTLETEPEVIRQLDDECLSIGILADIDILRLKSIKAPMLTGLTKPVILLPEWHYDSDDLRIILRHELTHYKRHDLWYKLVLVVIRSVYWFNPVIHLMAAQANKDLETVCDTLTIDGMDMETRKRYSEIILSMASGSSICKSQLTTCITGGKNMLRQRFSNILGATKRSGSVLFIILGAVVFAAGLLVGFNFSSKAQEPNEINILTSSALVEDDHKPSESDDNSFSVGLSERISENVMNTLNDTLSDNELMSGVSEYINDTIKTALNEVDFIDQYKKNDNAVYYESIDELKALVFDKARMTEHELENVSALSIITTGDHVSVTRGGDKLIVRYYEWVDNGYDLKADNGMLVLSQNELPFLKTNGNISDDWLRPYLESLGKRPYNTVEIIVPQSVKLDFLFINTMSGQVNVMDGEISNGIAVNTMSGGTYITNCTTANISISAMSGLARVENCISDNIKINSMSGASYIENCVSDYMEIDVMSGIGNIKLKDSADNYDISFNSDWKYLTYNGARAGNMNNPNATSKIKLSSMSGAISITDNAD